MTYTGPEILEHPIARHINQNIWDVEHRQRDVELVARQLQIFHQAIDLGVANVGSVNESQKPQTEKPRNLVAESIRNSGRVRSVSWVAYDVPVKLASDATVERRVDPDGLDSTEINSLDVCLLQSLFLVPIRTSRDRVLVYGSASHYVGTGALAVSYAGRLIFKLNSAGMSELDEAIT